MTTGGNIILLTWGMFRKSKVVDTSRGLCWPPGSRSIEGGLQDRGERGEARGADSSSGDVPLS